MTYEVFVEVLGKGVLVGDVDTDLAGDDWRRSGYVGTGILDNV